MLKQILQTDNRVLNYPQRLVRLRCLTLIFFLILIVPITIIFYMSVTNFQQEKIVEHQRYSEKILRSLNRRFLKDIAYSNAITYDEFNHYIYIYSPDTQASTKSLSQLANPKLYTRDAGLIGYFQVDQKSQFTSPVWPYVLHSDKDKKLQDKGLTPDFLERRKLVSRLKEITKSSPALSRLLNSKLPELKKRFQIITDVPKYFIYYRIVEVNDHRKLQGYVVKRAPYLNSNIVRTLNNVAFKGILALEVKPIDGGQASHYYQSNNVDPEHFEITQTTQISPDYSKVAISNLKLSWPLNTYRLLFSTSAITLSPTAIYSIALMCLLVIVIGLGCYGFYRLGVKQLMLAEQRLNFVSSVSHELKTPLTSIRMYSEMLISGQVLSAEHQKDYYEFIFSESERLSRLIDNILQLAKLSRPQRQLNMEYMQVSTLTDIIRSKVSSLLAKNNFELNIIYLTDDLKSLKIQVDCDAFAQVIINITDNAVKFFDNKEIADQTRQKLDFIFEPILGESNFLQLTIRDYGQGITIEQEKKLFDLFYRGGSELTRTTQGTGIGLALVNELMHAQNGTIKAKRMEPGLAMVMKFKCKV